MPLLQAEEDRDQVRRYLADQAREKELMGTTTRPYNTDRLVDRGLQVYRSLAHAMLGSYGRGTSLHQRTTRSERRQGRTRWRRSDLYIHTPSPAASGSSGISLWRSWRDTEVLCIIIACPGEDVPGDSSIIAIPARHASLFYLAGIELRHVSSRVAAERQPLDIAINTPSLC